MDTRNLIDYALDEDGVEFRQQLYASLHDRVMNAIEAKKQEIASGLIHSEEAKHADEAEDEEMIRRMVRPSALKKPTSLKKEELTLEDYSPEEIAEFMQTEDYEQLDELSKKTLARYIKNATFKVGDHGFLSGKNLAKGDMSQSDWHAEKESKRRKGIYRAADKLAREEVEAFMQTEDYEQLDELSKETMINYLRSAIPDKATSAFRSGFHLAKRNPKAFEVSSDREFNRRQGIKRALNKLSKEEVEGMEEGFDSDAKVGDKRKTATGTETRTATGVRHERHYEDEPEEGEGEGEDHIKVKKTRATRIPKLKENVSLQEGMRLMSKHGDGKHTAKVYKDTDWGEYRVRHYQDGKHMGEDTDSHHDDLHDAQSSAEHAIKFMDKRSK